jgi:hypothetical protein
MQGINACFEHSDFFTVTRPNSSCDAPDLKADRLTDVPHEEATPKPAGAQYNRTGPTAPLQHPTTSFLTATTLIYAIRAGITAGAGTRLFLELLSIKDLNCSHSTRKTLRALRRYLLSLLPCIRIGVIYAPAAFLGCGSHFSGSLSGIEP